DPFHQAGPKKEGSSRLAPHLIGEDAPPTDTLYDIAQKEKYYARPSLTLSPFSAVPNPESRLDTEMSQADGAFQVRVDVNYDSIITYGFPPEMASHILNEFQSFGRVLRFETGFYGRVPSESFNWLKIQYQGSWAAQNAVSRHLKAVGKYVVGVNPCQSFSTRASMDTKAVGKRPNDISNLTETEARQVQAGVGILLTIRSQGVGPEISPLARDATRARHSSLYDSWNQGGVGGAPLESSIITTLDDDTVAVSGRPPVKDQEDEDMVYILGRSLTSCGSIARSRQG
ncbi:Nucleoporin nup35, partial [Modicella reniformis]